MNEIVFDKYNSRGSYHWRSLSRNTFIRYCLSREKYDMCLKLLYKKINLSGTKVLDFGCGGGVLSYLLFKKGFIVSGTDVSLTAIRLALSEHKESKCKLF